MILIPKTSTSKIVRQLFNDNVPVDITSGSFVCTLREHPTSTDAVSLTIAGITGALTTGWFQITITSANLSSLIKRTYYCLPVISISGTDYQDGFFIKILDNKGISITSYRTKGTTAQRPTLTIYDAGFEYFDTDLDSPFWWNGSEWV